MIPTPEQPKVRTGLWVRIGVIAGVLVVAAIIGLVVRNILVARQSRQENLQQVAQATRVMEDRVEQCATAEDPEGCRRAAVNNQAVSVSSAELCSALEGTDLENCVRLIAQDSLDVADCRALQGESKQRCEDDVTIAVAKANVDLRGCNGMNDAARAEECRSLVTGLVVAEGTCRQNGIDTTLCEDKDLFNRAIETADLALCESFEAQARMNCRDEVNDVLESDTDRDGLSLGEERQYGTNPDVRDTDGDGFLDGEEVRGGYNPLGEGTL